MSGAEHNDGQLDAFAAPSTDERAEASRRRIRKTQDALAEEHRRKIEDFAPRFYRLAEEAAFVTLDELHAHLVRIGKLTGHEPGGSLSYFGAIPKKAGLVKVGEILSKRQRGHNQIAAWCIPGREEWARKAVAIEQEKRRKAARAGAA